MAGPQPDRLPEWASDPGADIVEPSQGEKEIGWATDERPPAQFFNWWKNLVFRHVRHLQDVQLNGLRQYQVVTEMIGAGKRITALSIGVSTSRIPLTSAAATPTRNGLLIGAEEDLWICSDLLLGPFVSVVNPASPAVITDAVWVPSLGIWVTTLSNGNVLNISAALATTEEVTGAAVSLEAITFGSVAGVDTLVAVGAADGGDAAIYTSVDGVNWTERANPKNLSLNDVAHDATLGVFVAAGIHDGSLGTPLPYLITSTDGVTWTQVVVLPATETDGTNPDQLWGVSANGSGLFVAVGTSDNGGGGSGVAMLFYSTTGSTWSRVAIPPVIITAGSTDIGHVRWIGGRFVAMGFAGELLSSFDGQIWRSHENGAHALRPAGGTEALSARPRIAGDDSAVLIGGGTGSGDPVLLVSPTL